MHISTFTLLAAASLTSAQTTFERSSKRGLVFVPSAQFPQDNQIWVEGSSDLTWYYNYQVAPSSAYSNLSQSEFEFVPMLWTTSTTFLSSIQSMISGGRNITHVLTYNEPDGTSATGGSQIDPATAATNWISQVEPLRKLGVKTGAPVTTGSQGGITWLAEFFAACQSQGTNCTADFLPLHYYGDFQAIASYIGQISATYPNISLWITEYALDNASLLDSQSFFNSSAEYFDRTNSIERYSYFGAFRSDVSNVGPNAAMLTQKGQLTSIGSWYLGGAATNNIPQSFGTRVVPGMGALLVAMMAGVFML